MTKLLRVSTLSFLIFIFSLTKTNVFAQDFLTDVNALVESCKNNFEDVKGSPVVSDDTRDIYLCLHQITGYTTTYLAINKGTQYSYVYATIATTGSTANDDCNNIKEMLASIPNRIIYDSKDDPNSNEDRHIQFRIPDTSGDILVNLILTLAADSYILISIQKPS